MSTTSTSDSAASIKAFGQRWWLLAVFGVITVGFGVVLTFKPGKSVHAIAVIIGIWLLILGVVRLIQAIGATGERTGFVIVGLLGDCHRAHLAAPHDHDGRRPRVHCGYLLDHRGRVGAVSRLQRANEGAVSWPTVVLGLIATIIGILCLVYPSLSLSIICVIVGSE